MTWLQKRKSAMPRERKGKKDHLVPGSKQWEERQAVDRHNSFLGSIRMMQVQLQAIIDSRTTTELAKVRAAAALFNVGLLGLALRTRAWPRKKEQRDV